MPSIKRLLVIGTSDPTRLDSFYIEAFRHLNVEVTLFDEDRALGWARRNRVTNRLTFPVQHLQIKRSLLKLYSRPRWDAVLVFKGYTLAPEALRACRDRAQMPWAVFNPDSPFESASGVSSRHIRRSISEYDVYFTWSRELVARLRKAGARHPVYLPFAHDPARHFPPAARDPSLQRTVAFVGTFDRHRASILEAIADMPIRVFGPGWGGLPRLSRLRSRVSHGAYFGADMRRLVGSSLACLNILRVQNAGSHNMRTFEVPAMGGVMLATRSQEQDEFFPEGDSSLMFEGPVELRSVISSLIAGQIDVEGIRARAIERSKGQDYLARAADILRELSAL